jgi:hypothetical protein
MPNEGAPGALRGLNGDPSGIAQGAAEVILTHQYLVELIGEVNLRERWNASRAPVLRFADRIKRELGAKEPDMDRALIGYLQKRLTVQAKGPDVTIGFDWPEGHTAFEVVRAAQQKFLVVRRAAELIPLERKAASMEASATRPQRRSATARGPPACARSRPRGASATCPIRASRGCGCRSSPGARPSPIWKKCAASASPN